MSSLGGWFVAQTPVALPVALLGAVFLATVAHFTANAPAWDDYAAILEWLLERGEQGGDWSYWRVFDPHNEHRVVALRLITLLAGANFQLIAFLGSCFLTLLAAFLANRVAAGLPASSRRDAVFVLLATTAIALILFSPRHWETTYWATTAASALPCLAFSFAAFWLLEAASRPRDPRFALAILTGIASTLSQTNGLLVWPVGAVMLMIGKQGGYKERLILWLAAGAVLAAVLFFVSPPSAIEKVSALNAERLVAAMHYSVRILGHGFSGGRGYLVAGLSASLFVVSIQRNVRQNLSLLGFAIFGLGSIALISLARSDLPLGTASSPRYALYTAVFLLSSCLLAVLGSSKRTVALLLFVAVAATYFVYGTSVGGRELLERRSRVSSQLRVLEATKGIETYSNLFAPADHLPRITDLLARSSRAGLYSLPRSLTIAAQPEVRFVETLDASAHQGGTIDGAPVVGNRLLLIGWHPIPLTEPGITLYVSGVPAVASHLYAIHERPDVANVTNKPELRFSGFELSLEFKSAEDAQFARANARITACGSSCYRLRPETAGTPR